MNENSSIKITKLVVDGENGLKAFLSNIPKVRPSGAKPQLVKQVLAWDEMTKASAATAAALLLHNAVAAPAHILDQHMLQPPSVTATQSDPSQGPAVVNSGSFTSAVPGWSASSLLGTANNTCLTAAAAAITTSPPQTQIASQAAFIGCVP